MAIDSKQLEEFIIKPTLIDISNKTGFNLYSDSSVNILLGTASVESDMGTYFKQINGPAISIYMLEPKTIDFIDAKFNHPVGEFSYNEFVYNIRLATIFARLKYYTIPQSLPEDPNDVSALAAYWKKYYNTPLGKGTEQDFIDKYKKYVTHK